MTVPIYYYYYEIDFEDLLPWIEARFSRSPGPGGQNVNKVATRVTLLFDFETCPALTDWQRTRIRKRLGTRLARDGRLRVRSHRERSQARNRSAAQTRLMELLTQAMHQRRIRRPTRPTAASRRRRLSTKRQRGELKRERRSTSGE